MAQRKRHQGQQAGENAARGTETRSAENHRDRTQRDRADRNRPHAGSGASDGQAADSPRRTRGDNRGKQPRRKERPVDHAATTAAAASRPGRDAFLPVSRADMNARGWDACDFVYVCGDAYVDHPSFGAAIITRVLEAHGYRVGVIAQPDWRDPASIQALGEPRLGFLVSAGNMDSMVNHYSVTKHRRHEDAYTPGGEPGHRPNHAAVVYSNLIRSVYKDAPIILGGIEASLRRLAHYDYWSDKLKRSILLDAGADLVIYGMGEHQIVEVADALAGGLPVEQITYVAGTAYRVAGEGALDALGTPGAPAPDGYELLPSWDELSADRLAYARSFNTQYRNMDAITATRLVEPYPNKIWVVQNPPALPLSTREMDEVYALPYARAWHPDYDAAGGVPAFDFDEVRFSLASNRGCFGECSFCALTFHQGRVVQVRSRKSIMAEARMLTKDPGFKGYITDVGGPTANFFHRACKKQEKHGVCRDRRCLWPSVCPNMDVDESGYTALLRDLRQLPGVKKVFVRSGIRFDYTMADASDEFLEEFVRHHVSGQLRLAPEHVSDNVLAIMGKPKRAVYDAFCRRFEEATRRAGLEQYVVPYLISSHPGSTMRDAVELAEAVRDMGYMPEQVQDFYPTPSTMSTCMYYTGVDPRTMEPVYVARDPREKAMQRALIQYRKPENWKLVKEALEKAGRADLIGYGKQCLIRPVPPKNGGGAGGSGKRSSGRPASGGADKRSGGRPTVNGTGNRDHSGQATSSGTLARGGKYPTIGGKPMRNSNRQEASGKSARNGRGNTPLTAHGGKQLAIGGKPVHNGKGNASFAAHGKNAAGSNPHARNRAAQGRQGANRSGKR